MDKSFIHELRKALNHLYDPERLIKSPLCSLLGVTGSFDQAISMQHILEDAIQQSKPSGNASIYSHNTQVFKFLVYRYLQHFSLQEVADELKVSQTQLYRIQQAALRDLAGALWQKYNLAARWPVVLEEKETRSPGLLINLEDLSWLSLPSPDKVADFRSTLEDVLELLQPAIDQRKIHLTQQIPDTLPQVAVHPVALRQVLLNLVNSVIHIDEQRCLHFEVEEQIREIMLQIDDACSEEPLQAALSEHDLGLKVVRQFTDLAGGELVYQTSCGYFLIRLSLPAVEGLPVLVIDDNSDHFELMQRYVRSTPYKLVDCPDPTQVVDRAIHSQAQIVLIDVLMPKFDGWAVLHSLRSHPDTAHLPVILFSIIPMDELALSLGANAFLHKPFKQEELIALLNQWVKPSGTMPGKSTEQNQ